MASSTCRLKYGSKGKSSLFKPYIVLGERNYAPISLNIGTTGASADSFTLLYPQSRSPWYPLKWRASLSARLGAWWKKKIYYRRESKGDLSVLQSVGYSLYRLSYPDSKLQLWTLRKNFSLYLSFFFLLPPKSRVSLVTPHTETGLICHLTCGYCVAATAIASFTEPLSGHARSAACASCSCSVW